MNYDGDWTNDTSDEDWTHHRKMNRSVVIEIKDFSVRAEIDTNCSALLRVKFFDTEIRQKSSASEFQTLQKCNKDEVSEHVKRNSENALLLCMYIFKLNLLPDGLST